ncbi:uncharacterized protein [Amphiura filiformis]|uniref:uncharacterized protein n=1 Tax=Amphiura filiformis TaxID=82378 RepID=UPI003B21CE00
MSIMRGLTTEMVKLSDLIQEDWFDTIGEIVRFMPQIPTVYTKLSREDMGEVREEEYLEAVKEGKLKVESGQKEIQQIMRFYDTKTIKPLVTKCKDVESWITCQKKLFEKLDLGEEFQALNLSEKHKFACFLCDVCHNSGENMQHYNQHVSNTTPSHKQHRLNICCARTTLGRMFIIKNLQRIAKDHADKDGEQKKSAPEANFCDVCMQTFEGKRENHNLSSKHCFNKTMRPKCEVCDMLFTNLKDRLHHVSRPYHKNTLQRKIENGDLPPDYKDPILEDETNEAKSRER